MKDEAIDFSKMTLTEVMEEMVRRSNIDVGEYTCDVRFLEGVKCGFAASAAILDVHINGLNAE